MCGLLLNRGYCCLAIYCSRALKRIPLCCAAASSFRRSVLNLTGFYIYKAAASLCVCVCVCVCLSVCLSSRFLKNCGPPFPWNFSSFIGVINRRERIKNIRKISTLNVYNFGKRCKIAHFEKVPTGDTRLAAQWPAVPVRELACALGGGTTAARANRARAWGMARSLPCGIVSNAFVLLSPVSWSHLPAGLWPGNVVLLCLASLSSVF